MKTVPALYYPSGHFPLSFHCGLFSSFCLLNASFLLCSAFYSALLTHSFNSHFCACQWPLICVLSLDFSWVPALNLSKFKTKLSIFPPNLWFFLRSLLSLIPFFPFGHSKQNPGSHLGLFPLIPAPRPQPAQAVIGAPQILLPSYLPTCLLHFLSHCLSSGSSHFLSIFLHSLPTGRE